ncbi:hypothetical protein QCB45_04150 [Thiomicrorhabdus sp. ZW0627]|uniref:hypothetical protein n=1 Tax=Thiomicrorhabdus sp. ZW0627 TaxID=3039774 RepID=UPI00243681D8|nr:hypothetical protein [Thiomicrorhabdus sp. ZW0627]MDG6773514.1 hypothetical protein [Thiomicrorhabdus sp. ZW0627]
MSHKHKAIIEKVFAHPISTNIDWKKLEHALEHFGAEIEISAANRAKIVIGENELVVSLPHHGHEISDKDEVTRLRHFLEEVKVTPDTI